MITGVSLNVTATPLTFLDTSQCPQERSLTNYLDFTRKLP